MSFNSLHNFLSLNAKIILNQVGKPGFSAGFQSVSNSKKLIAVWQIFICWIQCGLIVGSPFQHKLPPLLLSSGKQEKFLSVSNHPDFSSDSENYGKPSSNKTDGPVK